MRPLLIILLTLGSLVLAACAPALPLPTTPPATPPATESAPVRAIGLSLTDYRAQRRQLSAFSARLQAHGVNMVGINAGRLDWTYFPWPGHSERWSHEVREDGLDYLGEAAATFGAWSHVSAIVDVFVGRYLEEHPEVAARSVTGEASSFQVSIHELVDGAFGQQLLELITYIAANYPVDSIALTELFYDEYGYGDDDRAAYRAYTGYSDWPRTTDGTIDTTHPSIGAWRVHALSRFVARAATITNRHGKELFVDVRVSWGQLANEGGESGQDYGRFLAHADRLVLWNYFALSGYSPEYSADIARAMAHYGRERIIISIGLWGPDETTLPAEQLQRALQTIEASAVPNVWITPSHMLSAAHWDVIKARWGTSARMAVALAAPGRQPDEHCRHAATLPRCPGPAVPQRRRPGRAPVPHRSAARVGSAARRSRRRPAAPATARAAGGSGRPRR